MERKQGIYERYVKRILDIVCALAALIVFCWLYAILAILVRIKLGSPVLFTQPRPGKDEKIFKLYKFRSMTDARDENGNLLPDEVRLTSFGKALRATSLDELPEAINILRGDMSVIGPRPQLVRDMVFMTPEQRQRHTVRPGLSGLAQTRGRNAISWDGKLATDLEYIQNVTFLENIVGDQDPSGCQKTYNLRQKVDILSLCRIHKNKIKGFGERGKNLCCISLQKFDLLLFTRFFKIIQGNRDPLFVIFDGYDLTGFRIIFTHQKSRKPNCSSHLQNPFRSGSCHQKL